jgi:vacuolar-type H+-ATPase subunit H
VKSIATIKQAEQEALQAIEEAKQATKIIQKDAEKAATTQRESILKKAQQTVEDEIIKTKDAAEQEAKQIIEKNKETINSLQQQAQQRKERAVQLIIEEIAKGG